MAPAVSILIPVYNTAKYLDRALDSLFRQTCGDLEVIVIDDASPDNLNEMLAPRLAREKRLKAVHHTENRGTAAARRSGLNAAEGEYIICLDADDTLDPDAVRSLLKTARETDADIVGFGGRDLNPDGTQDTHGGTADAAPFRLEGRRIFDAVFRAHAFSWSLCLKMIRRELFLKAAAELPDHYCIFAEDFMYFSLIAFFAQKIITTGEIFYNYYQEVGITGSGTVTEAAFERSASMLNALKNVRAFLERHDLLGSYGNAFRLREKEQLRMLWKKREHMNPEDKETALEYAKKNYDAARIEELFAEYAREQAPAEKSALKKLFRTESLPWKILKKIQGAVKFRKSRIFYDC